jgi:hypothetical protein
MALDFCKLLFGEEAVKEHISEGGDVDCGIKIP